MYNQCFFSHDISIIKNLFNNPQKLKAAWIKAIFFAPNRVFVFFFKLENTNIYKYENIIEIQDSRIWASKMWESENRNLKKKWTTNMKIYFSLWGVACHNDTFLNNKKIYSVNIMRIVYIISTDNITTVLFNITRVTHIVITAYSATTFIQCIS